MSCDVNLAFNFIVYKDLTTVRELAQKAMDDARREVQVPNHIVNGDVSKQLYRKAVCHEHQ